MSVENADDADQPYAQVNGQIMDEMWEAAQQLPDDQEDQK